MIFAHEPVLQKRRSNLDNLGIIFHTRSTSLNKCCDPLLEPSLRDGSNEGLQYMFSLTNKQNYPRIILKKSTLSVTLMKTVSAYFVSQTLASRRI